MRSLQYRLPSQKAHSAQITPTFDEDRRIPEALLARIPIVKHGYR
jgi:hypothetical protein